MSEPAIVVIAYNRVKPLQRLLKSLARAKYPSNAVTLHISIDASTNADVKKVADDFNWNHGEKIVELKDENRGLLKHVLECGQLTEKYGSVIVLEDDLIVAPGFYNYAVKANDFYSKEEEIAGVSLFRYPVEENNFYAFEPIQDGSDVHFIQVASSWGQSWNNDQWSKFESWLIENPKGKVQLLPKYVQEWGGASWKRLFISYMIDTDRFFVFPNTSYSSNFEELGTHATDTGLFQVKLHLGDVTPRFQSFQVSNAIYDAYFELLPKCVKQLCPSLNDFDFEVDLYGEKPTNFNAEFVLTTRRFVKAEKSFGSQMKPLILNVINEIEGEDLVLCRKDELALTENGRFQLLNASSVRLDQFSQSRRQKHEQVSLVIPVLNDQVDALAKTISSLLTDRFYNLTLVIVGSDQVKKNTEDLLKKVSVRIEFISSSIQNIDDLLRVGVHNCQTDYCGWIQPGMLIDGKKMEEVARIFQDMAQVQVLHGMQDEIDEQSYPQLNTSNGRWTPQRAISNPTEVVKVRSECVFWRRSLLSENAVSNIQSGSLFLELMKLNPIYLVALKLGDFADVRGKSSVPSSDVYTMYNKPEFQPKKGLRAIVRPIFYFWFRRNVPFFRLFYNEMELMPLVIRYDFENDTFYLSTF